jgi:trk system potassium uptake protein
MPARTLRRMLVRPARGDVALIGLYTGRVVTGLGLIMLGPALLGFLRGEFADAFGFVIGASLAVLIGQLAEWRLATRRELGWSHGMVVVALSWLLGAFVGAVPLFLSGHYTVFSDAYFDAMSGFATAGLAVINDLDHLADSVNLWRHLMQFLGGQGLVLVALSFFTRGGGLVGLYMGEGREQRVMPNVVHSARFIWRVALTYALVGVTALSAALLVAGLPAGRVPLHAVSLFMAAFDTGGFAPLSASVGFYHSALVEAVIAVLMVAGACSFALHYQLWRGRGSELWHDLETRSLMLSSLALFGVLAAGLAAAGAYTDVDALTRRGFFHLLSAHTGTGFSTIPGRLFVTDWGLVAPAVIVVAMALGGMAGSTTGGIKALRLGLLAKQIQADAIRIVAPRDAVVVRMYHSAGEDKVVRSGMVRSAVTVVLLFLLLYLLGAAVGLFYGLSIEEALFESTSAAAAVGLSVGVVGPELPLPLKLVYTAQMWIGRLEFVAVFALVGYGWSLLRGRL